MSKGEIAQPVEKKENSKPEKYEIENAVNTLLRAEEIKNDKRLMPHVHKHIQKKKAAISSLAELKEVAHDRRKELIEEKQED